MYNLLVIVTMWNKVNELSRQSYSQAQIAQLLGVHRDTVRRYQSMSEKEFNDHLVREIRRHPSKLDPYRQFITDELRNAPFLSCPQILDHLKEHFDNLPYIGERTIYNYVQRIREEEEIPKSSEPVRQMRHVPDCEYGEKAQVDYGEKIISNTKGRKVKVYFFAMVLQRSRYKFIYLQNVPFTAKTTVYAHHLAFKYFGGMPKKVIYDQDKKMLVRENFGDYVMTDEFAKYVAEAGYEPVFCMAADPQSKGLVENVVRYVKGNFLLGRTYINIESLNEEVIGWLERTGNAKMNSSTHLVPATEFLEERKHLLPYRVDMNEPEYETREYNVRKDNTLLYRSNFYSLPLGTYSGPGAKVLVTVDVDSNELSILDPADYGLITKHVISPLKGKYISKEGHSTSCSREILESEKILREYFNQWEDSSPLSTLLTTIRKDRPRYYSKTVQAMASLLTDYDIASARTLVDLYNEHKIYNAAKMKEVATDLANRMDTEVKSRTKAIVMSNGLNSCDVMPEKRSVSEYKSIINGKEE